MSKKEQEQEQPVLADKLNHLTLDSRIPSLDLDLKNDIQDNLKHHLRNYQWGAIYNFNWSQQQPDADDKFNQVMFKMATGSGKTDLMAGLILYLYATKGYKYFIYVTKSKGVVDKTKDNFLNRFSDKYLFNPNHNININGTVRTVSGLPSSLNNPAPNTIYIDLTTINNLVNELNNGGDNKRSYKDFEDHKIVILADEAHHFNVDTKQTKSQKKHGHTWESTLDALRDADKKNRQLEFTATLDYKDDDSLYKKYKNKIIYEYSLKRFIHDGFAKNIYRLETSDDDHLKMINAILLSQYRKEIAKKCHIKTFKPVILFKSNRVDDSHNSYNKFNDLINNLSTNDLLNELEEQIRVSHSNILRNYVYKYWIKRLQNNQRNSTHSVIEELQRNFRDDTVVDMNDSGSTDVLSDKNNFQKVNSLEDPNNSIRVIFAVAKLTEGWDVLNLYDIVRLKEHKKNVTRKDTDSEAQLIGRGSRYYPFVYQGHKAYHRRFNSNFDIQHQLLERLYYHTIENNSYLNKLDKSLDNYDVEITDDNDIKSATAHLKDDFKQTNVYKYGYLFKNKTVKRKPSEKTSFKNSGIPTGICQIKINTGSFENKEFGSDTDNNTQGTFVRRQVISSDNGYLSDDPQLIKTAFQKLYYFFNFHNLKLYFPPLDSINNFITSSNWLGSIRLVANVDSKSWYFTSKQKSKNYAEYRNQQLRAVIQYFKNQLMTQIRRSKDLRKGTSTFEPYKISELIPDTYTKEIYNGKSDNNSANWLAHTVSYPMDKHSLDWFIYDNAIVDGLEYQCICDIGRKIVKPLHSKYHIFLIRNDEQKTQLKLHSFEDDQYSSQGYMPDFVLYMVKDGQLQNLVYQFYVEPKGQQLVEQDKWKEKLLESIKPNTVTPKPLIVHTINRNSKVKLYGLPFYVNIYEGSIKNKDDTHNMFDTFHKILFKHKKNTNGINNIPNSLSDINIHLRHIINNKH